MHLRFKRSRCHELSDQNNTFLSFAWSLPGVVEADNVRMLETLQHSGFLFETLTLRLGQLAILHTGQKRKISHTYIKSEETFTWKHEGRSIYQKQTCSINSTTLLWWVWLQSNQAGSGWRGKLINRKQKQVLTNAYKTDNYAKHLFHLTQKHHRNMLLEHKSRGNMKQSTTRKWCPATLTCSSRERCAWNKRQSFHLSSQEPQTSIRVSVRLCFDDVFLSAHALFLWEVLCDKLVCICDS